MKSTPVNTQSRLPDETDSIGRKKPNEGENDVNVCKMGKHVPYRSHRHSHNLHDKDIGCWLTACHAAVLLPCDGGKESSDR